MSNSFLQQRLPTLATLLAGMGLLIWALFSDERLLGLLFQPQGLALVIGGALCTAMTGFSFQELATSLGRFLVAFSGSQEPELQDVYDTTVHLATQLREAESPEAASRLMESVRPRLPHPLLREGLLLASGSYTPTMIRETLETTLAQVSLQYKREIRLWHLMAATTPAFGLAAAILTLLQATRANTPALSLAALAAALVCLLYGVLFAVLVFQPVAEQLEAWREHQILYLQMCLESVLLLQQRHHPLYVEAVLKPFMRVMPLPPPSVSVPAPARKGVGGFKQALVTEMQPDVLSEPSDEAELTAGQTLSVQQLRQFRPVNKRRDTP
jgi:chemotaxis protein MotA